MPPRAPPDAVRVLAHGSMRPVAHRRRADSRFRRRPSTWWAAWQTFNDGQQVIPTQPVGLSQHGATVQIEALERSAENEQGGYVWRGELRLWDGRVLMGYYAAADGNVRSKGTMFLVLHAQGKHAHGRWVGLSYDGPVVSGYATLARDQGRAKAVMSRLLDGAEAPA
jgi:hypothetical protein